MFELVSRNWGFLLLFAGIGIIFLPMKMYLRIYRGSNRIIFNSCLTVWFIPLEINMINPVTKTIWNLSRNSPWKKSPPSDLQASKVNWGRLFKRTAMLRNLFLMILSRVNLILRRISGRIKLRELNLYTEIGLFDAAQTAVTTGIIWSILGYLYGRVASIFNTSRLQKSIAVIPNYQKEGLFLIDYSCIFEFRLGHIIIIMYQVLRNAVEIYTIVRRITR
jgi:hypothetical protein